MAINGANLAPAGDTRTWQGTDFINNRMPTQLDGVSVTVNGKSAYVYYISPTQVNLLTPPDAMAGAVQVVVSDNRIHQRGVYGTGTIMRAPSFFVFDGTHLAATHLNGSYLGPASLSPGLTTPAKPGETVVLYGPWVRTNVNARGQRITTQSGALSPAGRSSRSAA